MFAGLLDLFAPAICVACRTRTGAALCSGCARGMSQPPARIEVPDVTWCMSPWSYAGPARDLVLGLKLRSQRGNARPLAGAICGALDGQTFEADVVTWVPARRRDVRQRGFDHAELIAREVSKMIGLPARPLLSRALATPDQTSLTRSQRRAVPAGTFRAATSPKRVLIVDDLVTTGGTLSACGSALRAGGAEEIAACPATYA